MKPKVVSGQEQKKSKHEGAGHRKRLRERFLRSGLDGFHDYEIVELLLTLGTPRIDCKQTAKQAINEFKGLRGVLDASIEELQKIKGIGPKNAFGIKLFQSITERYAKDSVIDKIRFNSPDVVANYIQKHIGRENKEIFVILYLDSRNNLIVDNISIGTLNNALVHPREVFKNAINANAAKVIVAHNHPSDDTDPSPEDIALTRRLVDASKIIGIELMDHIIVSKTSFTSIKAEGLM